MTRRDLGFLIIGQATWPAAWVAAILFTRRAQQRLPNR